MQQVKRHLIWISACAALLVTVGAVARGQSQPISMKSAGQATNPHQQMEMAVGSFSCAGSDGSRPLVSVGFSGTAGIFAGGEGGIDGTLELSLNATNPVVDAAAFCDDVTMSAQATAEASGCMTRLTSGSSTFPGSPTTETRKVALVCVGDRNQVIRAMGELSKVLLSVE